MIVYDLDSSCTYTLHSTSMASDNVATPSNTDDGLFKDAKIVPLAGCDSRKSCCTHDTNMLCSRKYKI